MPAITPITLPKWGLEMSEGTIASWHLEAGTALEKGAELVDIETDKIVNALEAEVAGVLRRILVGPGETAPVGALIAVVAGADVPEADIDAFVAAYKPVDASFDPEDADAKAPPAAAPAATPAAAPAATPAAAARSTPLARRVAGAAGVDLAQVPGSGPGGRVRRDDVLAAAQPKRSPAEVMAANAAVHASPIARKFANAVGLDLSDIAGTGRRGRVSLPDAQAAAQAAGLWSPAPVVAPARPAEQAAPAGTLQPFGGMRKSIARALSHSKATIPHFYTDMDVTLDALMALRADLNASGDTRVSVNDMMLRASALALAEHPGVNVHVSDEGTIPLARVDIAIAVAIDGGLLTPVLRDVAAKGLRQIAGESATLAAAARDRTLGADALAGAGFTVSNLGMFGVRGFSAIIAVPQAAILAVGGPRRVAVEGADGGVRFATQATLTLSADHRAVDGALAAQFLSTLRGLIEAPHRLLI